MPRRSPKPPQVNFLENLPAAIAQLVEHDLAKVGVASSSLVCRSKQKIKRNDGFAFFCKNIICVGGEIGIHATLRG